LFNGGIFNNFYQFFRGLSIGNDLKINRVENGELLYEGKIDESPNSYYVGMFEDNLIEKTNNYYKNKVSNMMKYSTPEYVTAVHKILKLEEQKLSLYFLQSKGKYIECIENQSITMVAEILTKVNIFFHIKKIFAIE